MKKLKQKVIAEQTCMSQQFVSAFLHGKRNCSLKTAKKFAAIYGCDPVWWMEATGRQRRVQIARIAARDRGGI